MEKIAIPTENEREVTERVMVSDSYEVPLPPTVREALGIRPGQELQVLLHNNRIELIPVKAIRDARGFLRGIDTNVVREPDRV